MQVDLNLNDNDHHSKSADYGKAWTGAIILLHSVKEMFAMIDYVREMTPKRVI